MTDTRPDPQSVVDVCVTDTFVYCGGRQYTVTAVGHFEGSFQVQMTPTEGPGVRRWVTESEVSDPTEWKRG
jgi:hypothetical protein